MSVVRQSVVGCCLPGASGGTAAVSDCGGCGSTGALSSDEITIVSNGGGMGICCWWINCGRIGWITADSAGTEVVIRGKGSYC